MDKVWQRNIPFMNIINTMHLPKWIICDLRQMLPVYKLFSNSSLWWLVLMLTDLIFLRSDVFAFIHVVSDLFISYMTVLYLQQANISASDSKRSTRNKRKIKEWNRMRSSLLDAVFLIRLTSDKLLSPRVPPWCHFLRLLFSIRWVF